MSESERGLWTRRAWEDAKRLPLGRRRRVSVDADQEDGDEHEKGRI